MSQQEYQVYHHNRVNKLSNPLRGLIHNPRSLVKQVIRPGDKVLDLGCGLGFFSVRIAQMLSSQGHVTAVDVQPEMLHKLEVRRDALGLQDRITTHLQPTPDRIGLDGKYDAVLAFYMLHEVGNQKEYIAQIRAFSPPHGLFLFVEPAFVVSSEDFKSEVRLVQQAGFFPVIYPKIALSRAVYFSPV